MQFTAPDLASIAGTFDAMEQDALEGNEHSASTNMDDTGMTSTLVVCLILTHMIRIQGFFSVQVMDRALDVWGLKYVLGEFCLNSTVLNMGKTSLVRWRSEQMRAYQESPQ